MNLGAIELGQVSRQGRQEVRSSSGYGMLIQPLGETSAGPMTLETGWPSTVKPLTSGLNVAIFLFFLILAHFQKTVTSHFLLCSTKIHYLSLPRNWHGLAI